jgi:hypothetical protein
MAAMLARLKDAFGIGQTRSVCLCTMAIHAPYRVRPRQLCIDAAPLPVVVLTDEPSDFADLDIRTVAHTPTGPMAADYLRMDIEYGKGRGGVVYRDKRFALVAALEDFETAIFVDAAASTSSSRRGSAARTSSSGAGAATRVRAASSGWPSRPSAGPSTTRR